MTATPATSRAFFAWAAAELAAHYAAPCSDETMGLLVDRTDEQFGKLTEAPTETAEDVLLKLFPVLLKSHEPRRGQPPLRPVYDHPEHIRGLQHFDSVMRMMALACPEIGAVMPIPYHRTAEEQAS